MRDVCCLRCYSAESAGLGERSARRIAAREHRELTRCLRGTTGAHRARMQDFLTTAFTALLVPACIVGDSAGDGRHVHPDVATDVIGLNVPADGTGADTVADL